MNRYLTAVGNDTRKAMTLYRRNLKLSQELFTVISCFEVALRNAIDKLYIQEHGDEWLKDSISKTGFFSDRKCRNTAKIIRRKYRGLGRITLIQNWLQKWILVSGDTYMQVHSLMLPARNC